VRRIAIGSGILQGVFTLIVAVLLLALLIWAAIAAAAAFAIFYPVTSIVGRQRYRHAALSSGNPNLPVTDTARQTALRRLRQREPGLAAAARPTPTLSAPLPFRWRTEFAILFAVAAGLILALGAPIVGACTCGVVATLLAILEIRYASTAAVARSARVGIILAVGLGVASAAIAGLNLIAGH
jgi:hypothetical protein